MNNYGLVATLTAKEGMGAELVNLLIEASELLGKNKDCYQYLVSKDVNNLDTVVITEVWKDKEAHDLALQKEDIRAIIGKGMPLLATPPNAPIVLDVVGGLFVNV